MNRLRWGLVSASLLLIATWVLLGQLNKVYDSAFTWPRWTVTGEFLLIVLVIYLLSILVWRAFAAHTGVQRSFTESLIDTGLISISKYAPGKIWGVLARGGLKQRNFTLSLDNIMASGLEQGYLLLYGFITSLAILLYPYSSLPLLLYVPALVAFIMVFSLIAAVSATFIRRFFRRIPAFSWTFLSTIGMVYVILWLLNGAALLIVGQSFASVTIANSPQIAAYFIMSIAVGWLVIFVPGGIGVREGVFVYLVKDILSVPDALILASLHRGLITIFDLGFGGASLLYTFYSTRTKAPQ